ncbi:hypothetical protein ACTZWT_22270 [Rhodopseudomonas sp. NSM]
MLFDLILMLPWIARSFTLRRRRNRSAAPVEAGRLTNDWRFVRSWLKAG